MGDDLLFENSEGVAWITLNRPDSLNAMSNDMMRSLGESLDRCANDDEIRAVVLTGAGDRAFCAGGDVKGMAARTGGSGNGPPPSTDDRIAGLLASMRRSSLVLHTMPKPTIASINGYAMGAGLSLALACDLRIMAAEAQLGTAFAGVALAGDYGGTWFMTRLIGAGRARELYLLNERVPAEKALDLGLVNWVVPRDELRIATQDLASRLASGPTKTLGMMKASLVHAEHADLESLLALEARHQVLSGATEDHREAAKAFVEKRKPNFVGR
ncbi:MAG TPA: enoyl-CoA hydratase [Actinomycetota bacterium]|nr:enoyl-CoA hydratase [Actinomycetota bacterium]